MRERDPSEGRSHRPAPSPAGCLIPSFDGAPLSPAWRDALLGQVLHGSATTTEAIRRAIQHSQASRRALAKRHGINPKTVAKWKKRPSAEIDANVRFAASQPTRSSAGVAPELPNARMAHKGSTPAARWWPRERPESAPSRHWAGHRGWSALHLCGRRLL